MRQVLLSLLETSVYATILWAAILALRKLLGNRMSAKLRLVLWMLFLTRLVCPITIDTGVHLFPVLPPASASSVAATQHSLSAGQNAEAAPGTQLATNAEAPATGSSPPAHLDVSTPASDKATYWPPDTQAVQKMLFSVWITGIAVLAAVATTEYAKLRRRVRRHGMRPDSQLARTFSSCRRQMGIARKLRLVVTDAVRGPSLLIPRTILYPPGSESLDEREMRMSMMHELTHYKRRDPLLLVLLLVVRTVYWFNPIVWTAIRQIREDMEAACDADVVAGWPQGAKADYARTILLMHGASSYEDGVAAFASSRSATQLEQRIRRIFMKRTSSRTARLAALAAACVLAVACFTTACQPSQGMDPPTTSNMRHMKAEGTPSPSGTAAQSEEKQPEKLSGVIPGLSSSGTWNAQMTLSDGTVDIAAQEFLPDTDTLPAYSIEPTQVTPEMVEDVAHALWGEDLPEFQVAPAMTKERRDSIVEQYERLIRKYEQDGPDPDEDMPAEERIAQWKGIIEDTERLYQESQASRAPQAADFSTFYYNPADNTHGLSYDVLFADGTRGQLTATSLDEECDWARGIHYRSDAYEQNSLAGFTGSLDEAVADASTLLTRLDAGTWTLHSAEADPTMGCAILVFRPAMGQVPMIDWNLSSATGASVMSEEESAAYQRGEFELPDGLVSEKISVMYDDTGLAGFFWSCPWTITGVVEESPDIVPIEDAQDIFMANLDENNGDGIPADEITVDRVELAYAYSYAKDEPDACRMIPVYDFLGSTTHYAKEGYPISWMTVNALDGSIFRRETSI